MRFVDNQDGTVTDSKTGLVWLKNAGASWSDQGRKSEFNEAGEWVRSLLEFGEAAEWVRSLSHGNGDLSDGSRPGDWQIPTKRQLLTLVDKSQQRPALPIGHPFINVCDLSSTYWTRDRYHEFTGRYFDTVDLDFGSVDYAAITFAANTWPVRTGPEKVTNIPMNLIIAVILICIAVLLLFCCFTFSIFIL
jgi:hypothetical protein